MANEETVRSFLVGLGWKNDTTSERRFVGAIEGATLKANLLAQGIAAMAESVGKSFGDMADQANKLQFLATVTQTSTGHIRDLESAFEKMGQGAGAADAMVSAVTTKLQTYNRANIEFAEKVGFTWNAVNKQYEFSATKAQAFLKGATDAQKVQFAGLTGASKDTIVYLATYGDQVQGWIDEHKEMRKQFGITDETIKTEADYSRQLISIWANVGAAYESVSTHAAVELTPGLEKPNTWIQDKGPNIATQIKEIGDSFQKLGGPISEAGKAFASMLTDASGGKMDDIVTDVGHVTDALKGFVEILTGIFNEVDRIEKGLRGHSLVHGLGLDKPPDAHEKQALDYNASAHFFDKVSTLTNLPYVGPPLDRPSEAGDIVGNVLGNAPPVAPLVPPPPLPPAPAVVANSAPEQPSWWQRTAPTWLGGQPNESHLARGGIVDQPTHALIGEQGPEAVIPLGSEGVSVTIKQGGTAVQSGNPLAVRIEKIDPAAAGIGGDGGGGGEGRTGLMDLLRRRNARGRGDGASGESGEKYQGGPPSTKGLNPELVQKIRDKATQWGIDPNVALRVYKAEGPTSTLKYMEPGDNNSSFGPFQLHEGGAGAVGTEYEKATGHNVRDPKYMDDYLDFTMKWVRQHGWDAWSSKSVTGVYGKTGVGPMPTSPPSTPPPSVSVSPIQPPVQSEAPSVPPAPAVAAKVPASNIRLPAFTPGGQTYPSPNETDGSGKPTGAYDFNRQRQSLRELRENARLYAEADLASSVHHHYDNSDHSITHSQTATNHITITGVSDPQEAANAVGSTMSQIFPKSKSTSRHLASALG